MSGRFAGKSVFVTGGARGIGAAIAGAFAAEGAVVTVADKDEDAAIETAGRIGPSALGLGCNVTSRAAVAEAMAEAERNWGGIDVLFNNAGLHTRRYNSPVTQVSEELWAEMLQVNLMGAVNCATVAAPMLARRGGGAILNNSSVSGIDVRTAYGITKLALRGLTVALARELAGQGTRVNAIAPGLIQTDTIMADLGEAAVDSFVDQVQWLRRPAMPTDLAGAILFLCSDEASFITGETLVVSGGYATRW
jgi:3-oxoacyl-[acyl-carrier protein] reductase